MLRTTPTLVIFGLTLGLGACGDGSHLDTSNLADREVLRASETLLLDVAASPANGGINPDFLAVDVTGSAYLAGNACAASGLDVRLVEERNGDTLTVVAVRERAGDEPLCNETFAPVYKDLKTTVRFRRDEVAKILVKNVDVMGQSVNVSTLLARPEAVLEDVAVNVVDGGINPDAFAYVIKGSVMAGANPCMAANAKIDLVQTRLGERIVVKAVRTVLDPGAICTLEYNPTLVDVATQVRDLRTDVDAVVIKNVGELGRNLSASDLIVTR